MKTSRRGFLKALGLGAAGVGVATVLPMGLLGVTETKYERIAQQMLKARILNKEGFFDRMHDEINGALVIINNELDHLKFEDVLFGVATIKYAMRDCQLPLDHRKLKGFKEFHNIYGTYILGMRNDPDPLVAGVNRMLKADVDSKLHSNNILRGYYPELPGKRTIV